MRRILIFATSAALLFLAGFIGYLANSGKVYDPPSSLPTVPMTFTSTTVVPSPSLPAGTTYEQVKKAILSALDDWWADNSSVGKGFPPYGDVDCVLPPRWAPGEQFSCTTLAKGYPPASDGTATIYIESANPGQKFTILAGWQSNS
jgi:hypothetical protein